MAEKLKGQDILVKIDNTLIGGQKNATLDISANTIDATTKDSEGWTEAINGDLSWSATCDGLYLVSDTGYKKLLDQMIARKPVDLTFADSANKLYRKGKAIITAISEDAGKDDVVSYSASFTGTGPLTTTNPLAMAAKTK